MRVVLMMWIGLELGCAASLPAPVPAESDVARGVRFGEVTLASLEAGRALFLERCAMCHEAPAVKSNTPERWEVEVARMYERAGLDEAQRGLVLRYLQTFARD